MPKTKSSLRLSKVGPLPNARAHRRNGFQKSTEEVLLVIYRAKSPLDAHHRLSPPKELGPASTLRHNNGRQAAKAYSYVSLYAESGLQKPKRECKVCSSSRNVSQSWSISKDVSPFVSLRLRLASLLGLNDRFRPRESTGQLAIDLPIMVGIALGQISDNAMVTPIQYR
jgi:hypothetical protein